MKRFWEKTGEKVGSSDIFAVLMEKQHQPMHIAVAMPFTKPDNAASDFVANIVHSMVRSQAPLVKPFDQVLQKGNYWTKTNHVDFNHHIKYISLPQPANHQSLQNYLAKEHSHMLDRDCPLWEFHFIDGLENNRFAVYFKIHHVVLDGAAIVQQIKCFLSEDKASECLEPFWSKSIEKQTSQVAKELQQSFFEQLQTVKEHLTTVPQVSRELYKVITSNKACDTKPSHTPKSLFNDSISSARNLALHSFKMQRFVDLAQGLNVTVNDIALSVCAGALREYLQMHNALPKKSLTAILPVSLRDANKEPDKYGVDLGFMLTSLATDTDDIMQRLQRISSNTNASKERFSRMSKTAIVNFSKLFFSTSMIKIIMGWFVKNQGFNITISNVPGARKPLYLNGAKLEAMYPLSCISHGQAMNITLMSYDDNFDFGIIASSQVLPDIECLPMLIEQQICAFEQLLTELTDK